LLPPVTLKESKGGDVNEINCTKSNLHKINVYQQPYQKSAAFCVEVVVAVGADPFSLYAHLTARHGARGKEPGALRPHAHDPMV
jgi:hypothetical protein